MASAMTLNRTFYRVDVSETEHDRNYWAVKMADSPELVAQIRSADLLFVPWENRGKEGSIGFPSGTAEFYQTISKQLAPGNAVLASTPDGYCEIVLHANEVRWPTLFVSTVLLTALGNILSTEIEKLISSPAPPTTVEVQVVVEGDRGKCISVQYKGPPGRLVETLMTETERCLPSRPPVSKK